MTMYPVRTRRWTRAEYDRLAEVGVLREDEPVELLDGQMVVAEPKGSRHATQDPVALDDASEPEPDVVVVPGPHRAYLEAHPVRPALVVEVAESSLAFDRWHKGGLYARAGIADYWIVDVVGAAVEVHRGPVPDLAAEFGWRHWNVETFRAGASISPLWRPDVTVAVADLLP